MAKSLYYYYYYYHIIIIIIIIININDTYLYNDAYTGCVGYSI